MKTLLKILIIAIIPIIFNLKSYSNTIDSTTTVQYEEKCWGTKNVMIFDENKTGKILVFNCDDELVGVIHYKRGLKHGKTIMYKNNRLYAETIYKRGVGIKSKML